ncbi:hypothetical protein DRW48_03370 [Paracoccus suum]|uniref:Sulfotransferase domain-containing protein n=1 Tax=Paracoccus suum TaxID=2259340 RepID=A0A344PHK5_9RHOB|nr:hypothetical protein [Paracoccus suum]AXC48860.1 hypothetical protein DRW48_03370 [Paracoccus suum]
MPEDCTICVRGVFRSGTNFLKALLEVNYDCVVSYDSLGWKHGFFPIPSTNQGRLRLPNVPVVTMVKNPLHAAVSLYKYVNSGQPNMLSENTGTISQFIRSPFTIQNGDVEGGSQLWFPDLPTFWAQMSWNALSASDGRTPRFTLRYEDLLEDAEAAVAPIASAFSLARRSADFEQPDRRLKRLRDADHDPEKFYHKKKFDRQGVMQHSYLAEIPSADIDFIAQRLPYSLLERLGYATLVRDAVSDEALSERALDHAD